ncbi:uncharacterized protein B0H18DRAFT_1123922 [Fomitopsis serialis]|uniref:uncharacterized protein n=1 Tax=Fomitopsis serialis TaxID=139415 RepID=UPI002008E31F|nr:uncharacterized protein B0H18DRAFT_1123922 [Neoantrodia serialis]KAH9916849.1 hypothetical protein B0H18DRAFT_1123922 [Neoantrodia serialis]
MPEGQSREELSRPSLRALRHPALPQAQILVHLAVIQLRHHFQHSDIQPSIHAHASSDGRPLGAKAETQGSTATMPKSTSTPPSRSTESSGKRARIPSEKGAVLAAAAAEKTKSKKVLTTAAPKEPPTTSKKQLAVARKVLKPVPVKSMAPAPAKPGPQVADIVDEDDTESSDDDDDIVEVDSSGRRKQTAPAKEETPEEELERLSKDWVAPIYAFYKREVTIHIADDGKRAHVFECIRKPTPCEFVQIHINLHKLPGHPIYLTPPISSHKFARIDVQQL